ncbi:NAD-dependent succinate-semialdehyde dehydrogenase [Mycolicibacterium sp. CBM1]
MPTLSGPVTTGTSSAIATVLIDGSWETGAAVSEVRNPATGEVIGFATDAGPDDARRALDAAASAFPVWREHPVETRSTILRAAAAQIRHEAEQLSELMTRENGKPIAESRVEIANCARILEWSGEEARRAYGRVLPPAAHGPSMVMTAPVGPTLAISPWNFPGSMFVRKLALSLAAGCTVVAKPADLTPLIAVALTRIIAEAGVPAGALNLITTTRPGEVTAPLLADPRLRKISFTGSTRVGLTLAGPHSGRLPRVSLELGGHSPAIVLADADVSVAAAGIVAAKFANAGQSCTAINRVYAPRESVAALTAEIVARVAKLRLGNGLDPETSVGPLINEAALEKTRRHVDDAVARGATVHAGGGVWQSDDPTLHGYFFEPTVLTDVPPDAAISREETFGPVLPIFAYDDRDEAIVAANDLEFGLAAYIFGRDLQAVWRTFEALDFGVIGVNDPFPVRPELPFGGTKNSGQEREGGSEGISAYLETKSVSIRFA